MYECSQINFPPISHQIILSFDNNLKMTAIFLNFHTTSSDARTPTRPFWNPKYTSSNFRTTTNLCAPTSHTEPSDINSTVQKFWDDRPCNIRHSSKELGTKEYFEEVTKRKYFVENHILSFANFPSWKDKDVLEVGCGLGTAAQSFMEAGAKYTGIDVSPKSIELAQRRAKIFNLTGDIFVADIQSFIPDGKHFDLVYSFGVLHHIQNLEAALKNIYAVLKPGGQFKLMMYATKSWKKACVDSGLDQFEAQSGVPIANTYTNDEIRALLGDFTNIQIEQDHIFQWNVDEYRRYSYKKEPWFESMPGNLIRTLEKEFGWHLLITCDKPSQ